MLCEMTDKTSVGTLTYMQLRILIAAENNRLYVSKMGYENSCNSSKIHRA